MLGLLTIIAGLSAAGIYGAAWYLKREGWPRPAWMGKAIGPLLVVFCAIAAWWVFLALVGR